LGCRTVSDNGVLIAVLLPDLLPQADDFLFQLAALADVVDGVQQAFLESLFFM